MASHQVGSSIAFRPLKTSSLFFLFRKDDSAVSCLGLDPALVIILVQLLLSAISICMNGQHNVGVVQLAIVGVGDPCDPVPHLGLTFVAANADERRGLLSESRTPIISWSTTVPNLRQLSTSAQMATCQPQETKPARNDLDRIHS